LAHIEPVLVYLLFQLGQFAAHGQCLTAATLTKSSPGDGIAIFGSVAECSECAVIILPRDALKVSDIVLSVMASSSVSGHGLFGLNHGFFDLRRLF